MATGQEHQAKVFLAKEAPLPWFWGKNNTIPEAFWSKLVILMQLIVFLTQATSNRLPVKNSFFLASHLLPLPRILIRDH